MSDISLETINKRTAIAAFRQETARLGVDGDTLLDSRSLFDQVTALDPDEPGFAGRVREIAGEAAGRPGGARPAASPQQQNQAPRQWTIEDVQRLPKTREGGKQLEDAIEAGLLTDLGYSPTRRR